MCENEKIINQIFHVWHLYKISEGLKAAQNQIPKHFKKKNKNLYEVEARDDFFLAQTVDLCSLSVTGMSGDYRIQRNTL